MSVAGNNMRSALGDWVDKLRYVNLTYEEWMKLQDEIETAKIAVTTRLRETMKAELGSASFDEAEKPSPRYSPSMEALVPEVCERARLERTLQGPYEVVVYMDSSVGSRTFIDPHPNLMAAARSAREIALIGYRSEPKEDGSFVGYPAHRVLRVEVRPAKLIASKGRVYWPSTGGTPA